MEYCNNATVLPPPINILAILVDCLVCCCSYLSTPFFTCFKGKDGDANCGRTGAKKRKYGQLVKSLALKYENDFEDSEENDATKEHLDKLNRDMKKMASENSVSVREDLEGIAKMLRDLGMTVQELKMMAKEEKEDRETPAEDESIARTKE